jgi:hypothetical protein
MDVAMKRQLITALLLVVAFGHFSVARAEWFKFNLRPKMGTLDLDPRTSLFGYHKWKPLVTPNEAQLNRAGNPQSYSIFARCQDDRKYSGYYIGGGAAYAGNGRWGGDRPYANEGTWGWDYAPWYSRVKLRWFHGRRYQGGEGQYNPDVKSDPLEDFRMP